jgi:hypothetical protein
MDLTPVGIALAEMSEIRWRRGDLVGAEEAFTRAVRLGSPPHPGMALVRLAQGMCVGPPPRSRSPWLTTSGTVWVGHGCCRPRWRSRSPTVMLEQRVRPRRNSQRSRAATPAPPWPLPPSARRPGCYLPRVIPLWRPFPPAARSRSGEAGAPYETARAHLLLGEALEQHGDRKHAVVEFDAARAAFQSLGLPWNLLSIGCRRRAPGRGATRKVSCYPWVSTGSRLTW